MKKYLNYRRFKIFAYSIAIGIILIPLMTFFLEFIYLFSFKNYSFTSIFEIFFSWNIEIIKNTFLPIVVATGLIYFLLVFCFIHFFGKLNNEKIKTRSLKNSLWDSRWLINEKIKNNLKEKKVLNSE